MKPVHYAATAAFLLASAASTAPKAQTGNSAAAPDDVSQPIVRQERTAAATVESLDQVQRIVVLKTADGTLLTIEVGPEVRNFAQIHPGDLVTAIYRESIAAAMAKPDGPPLTAGAMSARAPLGERPAGMAAHEITARVRIDGVDAAANAVTFTGPAGQQHVVAVRDPGMQRFAATLRPGDDVDITYTEAIAIRVDPMKP